MEDIVNTVFALELQIKDEAIGAIFECGKREEVS